jgi:hypothetical protein
MFGEIANFHINVHILKKFMRAVGVKDHLQGVRSWQKKY